MSVECITSVLVASTACSPASPYDLTDLATVKDELSVKSSDNDTFLQRAITQASRVIANYCNRTFTVETIQDQIYIEQDPYPYQVPGGVYPLQLSRWPLTNFAVIGFTGNTHSNVIVDGISSTKGLIAGMPVFVADGSLPAGTLIKTVTPVSIELNVPASSQANGVSFTTGIQVVQTRTVGDTQTLIYGQDFIIDALRGWLIRVNPWTAISVKWEAEPVTVQYQAGYSPIPDDLVEACLKLVTARFRARGRDPMLTERAIPGAVGSERYWVGASPGQRGSLPPEVEALVDQYRVPVTS